MPRHLPSLKLSKISILWHFPGGSAHEESGHNNRRNVVMKARQVGSEIRGYDISDSAMDPTFLKV